MHLFFIIVAATVVSSLLLNNSGFRNGIFAGLAIVAALLVLLFVVGSYLPPREPGDATYEEPRHETAMPEEETVPQMQIRAMRVRALDPKLPGFTTTRCERK